MERATLEDVRRFAQDLLERSGYTEPPVNPLLVGARHEVYFRVTPLPPQGRPYRVVPHEMSWVVALSDRLDPREMTLQAASAVIEALYLPTLPTQLAPPLADELCDGGAAEMLMPKPWFRGALNRYGFDLPALQRIFGTSFEAIAWRMLDFRSAILSVFDHGELTFRRCADPHDKPPPLTEVEQTAADRCAEEWRYVRVAREGMQIECHATEKTDETCRVICFTMLPEERR